MICQSSPLNCDPLRPGDAEPPGPIGDLYRAGVQMVGRTGK